MAGAEDDCRRMGGAYSHHTHTVALCVSIIRLSLALIGLRVCVRLDLSIGHTATPFVHVWQATLTRLTGVHLMTHRYIYRFVHNQGGYAENRENLRILGFII